MMLLSIDVGIKNLAMCLIDPGTKKIHEWEVSGVPPQSTEGLFPSLKRHMDARHWVRQVPGTVIIESLINGLPVITTAECGYAPHVRKADAGLVIPSPFTQEAWAKSNKIGVTLVSDLNKTVIKAYDVVFPNLVGIGDTAARAAFVIGTDGVVKYAEQTPTPKDLPNFAAIKAALAK